MKIIGFSQLRNELSKGNLHNYFKSMEFCDYIYIYDQASDDGSQEVYKQHDNAIVIQSETNKFNEEVICKKELLEKLLSEHPDTDWIFWMDGDTCLEKRLMDDNFSRLYQELERVDADGCDGAHLHNLNLWRSNRWARSDNSFNGLDPLCFWKNTGRLEFPAISGLHKRVCPLGIINDTTLPYDLIHYGFSTDEQIIERYKTYKSLGQSGWELDRLLDESGIALWPLSDSVLPSFVDHSHGCKPDGSYDNRRRSLWDVLNNNIEIIAMVYKSTQYLDFIYDQLKSEHCKADGWGVTLRIVANDATGEVLERLHTLDVPFSVYNDPKPDDFYLNRVYRCWNYCVESSQCGDVCLVNSDMAFSKDWLSNLLKHHDGINIPCSRLVESGKMPSGLHGISNNCGTHPNEFNSQEFERYAGDISEDKIEHGGLFMPVVFNRKRFLESGKYPEGNVYRGGIGASNTKFVKSGDAYFFYDVLENKLGMKHVTAFDSVVYHIQEGEMDE